MAKFYVVGTPIGNLKDITLRALEVLKSVDLILCEDTRVTKKLLGAYDIATSTMSYHSHSGLTKVDKIIELLNNEKDIALVSDAGTPAISDPGASLVARLRAELPALDIVSIPGPSALTAAFSIAGMQVSDFLFLGFLPHKKGREKLFTEITESKRVVVFYESPHRIMKTLGVLCEKLGSSRSVIIAREITKMHEEVILGNCETVLSYFQTNPDKIRGEFVVLVSAL
ncbi:MAG TPA: 16S rRNA (cytidine(1402)-2'-O)-methyltransferase [Candidatus Paceibacterota bacterium]